MQLPPQLIWVPPHETWHRPPEQTWPAGQTFPSLAPAQSPDAPQYVRFVSGSMQLPPHSTRLEGQESWQVPSEHTSPAAHEVPSLAPVQSPEAPQYPRSVCGLTHVPLQLICEPGQDTAQVPAPQTWPAGQTLPSFAPVQSPEAPQ
jgi:hypothetical protein